MSEELKNELLEEEMNECPCEDECPACTCEELACEKDEICGVSESACADDDVRKCECEDCSKEEDVKDVKYEPTEEEIEEKRLETIKVYNEQNLGSSWIEDGKPTPEEVKAIAEEYKTKVEAFNAEKFTISDKANALRVAKFLKKWNEEDVPWESEGWRGAIFFDAIIKQFIEECEKEEKDLVVDWQTLTYLFMFMRNIKGVGLKSAIKFSTIAEEYNQLLDVIGDEFTRHNEGGEKMRRLQEKWAAYEHGFKIHYCDEEKDAEIK